MKTQSIRWQVRKKDLNHLSSALKPIRSYEDVSIELGISGTMVRHLETSALRKIMRALGGLENEGEHHP